MPGKVCSQQLYLSFVSMVLYRIESSGDDRVIGVKLENQFGKQKIVIYRDIALMVPARRRIITTGSKFANRTKLDHYKIYRVVEHSDIHKMTLKPVDQFQKRRVEQRQMAAFAVPVHKRHCGEDFEIINEGVFNGLIDPNERPVLMW